MQERIIPGAPVSCPRPRVTKYGTFYPPKYKAWREKAKTILQDLGEVEELEIIFVFPRPKRLKEGPRERHQKKPDIDNCIKAVLDSLPHDDKYIHTIISRKLIAASNEAPHIEIRVYNTEDQIPF